MDPLKKAGPAEGGEHGKANPVQGATATAANPQDKTALFARLGVTPEENLLPLAAITPDRLVEVCLDLRAMGYILFDVVGIDFGGYVQAKPKRFGVTYNLYNIDTNDRVFLRAYLDEGEPIASLYPVWKSANYLEREVFDLVGVRFTGHPDLRKVLTPEDLEGHPLRKDFPLGESPTLFRDGRFIDPPSFRAGLTGQAGGLTGWRGGERKGFQDRPDQPPVSTTTREGEKA